VAGVARVAAQWTHASTARVERRLRVLPLGWHAPPRVLILSAITTTAVLVVARARLVKRVPWARALLVVQWAKHLVEQVVSTPQTARPTVECAAEHVLRVKPVLHPCVDRFAQRVSCFVVVPVLTLQQIQTTAVCVVVFAQRDRDAPPEHVHPFARPVRRCVVDVVSISTVM
jgi:hypothetical protein